MVRYEYDFINKIVHVYPSKILTEQDSIRYFETLLHDPSIKEGSTEKVYFSDLDDIQFSYKGVIRMRAKYQEIRDQKLIAETKFIVNSDFAFGIARMLQSVFDAGGMEMKIERISP